MRQWEVTAEGMRAREGMTGADGSKTPAYVILDGAMLGMERGGTRLDRTVYSCPLHMIEKPWVDVEDFMAAYERALIVHSLRADRHILRDTRVEAVRRRART